MIFLSESHFRLECSVFYKLHKSFLCLNIVPTKILIVSIVYLIGKCFIDYIKQMYGMIDCHLNILIQRILILCFFIFKMALYFKVVGVFIFSFICQPKTDQCDVHVLKKNNFIGDFCVKFKIVLNLLNY